MYVYVHMWQMCMCVCHLLLQLRELLPQHLHVYMHICLRVYVADVYVCIYASSCPSTCAKCMYAYMHMCICAYVHMCVCVYVHI